MTSKNKSPFNKKIKYRFNKAVNTPTYPVLVLGWEKGYIWPYFTLESTSGFHVVLVVLLSYLCLALLLADEGLCFFFVTTFTVLVFSMVSREKKNEPRLRRMEKSFPWESICQQKSWHWVTKVESSCLTDISAIFRLFWIKQINQKNDESNTFSSHLLHFRWSKIYH